ncbi:MAG TPA: hypothetical protein VJR92_06615 [Gemmatimonadaceae bacterium]|nr:hypothetical protein [Gemmatimonadaceae bacterium]
MTTSAIAKRLEQLRDQVKAQFRPRATQRRRARKPVAWQTIALGVTKVLVIACLPFIMYVRASVFFYHALGGAPWIAVAGGMFLTLVVVVAYATWLAHGVFGKETAVRIARSVVAPIVGAWLVYSLIFLARVNAKTDDVQDWYSSLHPVLRVAVSTAIILDRDMVITDMQRVAADYKRIGLPVNRRTRHYVQSDGWVHAVDLRTNGRGEIRNRMLQLYFWSMGFSTQRHVGRGDHLHVQLR